MVKKRFTAIGVVMILLAGGISVSAAGIDPQSINTRDTCVITESVGAIAGIKGTDFTIPKNVTITGDVLRSNFKVVDAAGNDLNMPEKIRFVDGKGRLVSPEAEAETLIKAFAENPKGKYGLIAMMEGYRSIYCDVEVSLGPDVVTPPVVTGNITYSTHVQNYGWQNKVKDGEMSGTKGESLRLEGIKIESGITGLDIEYATHVQDIGWQDFVKNGIMSGTSAKSLRLEAIKIKLSGDESSKYDVYYRVHAQNIGWMGWASNGDDSGTAGFGYRLEGIEIKLVEKGGAAPGTTDDAFLEQ